MKNANDTTSKVTQSKNDVVTNIYLSSQKKAIDDNSMEVKSDGVKVVKEGSSSKDIEKGAKILNLGLEKQEVIVEESIKEQTLQRTSSSTFDRLSLVATSLRDNIENKTLPKTPLDVIAAKETILKDNPKAEKVVELSVNSALTPTIQNRIVAARQHMSSMMSDLARTMYENYKPPVTAFRVNLNPSALGSIAIVLRNEQKNSISISMNMSNSSTKEVLIENQSSLKDSLSKAFSGQTDFNLNFDLNEQSYEESKNNESFNEELTNNSDSTSIDLENLDEKEKELKDTSNYM